MKGDGMTDILKPSIDGVSRCHPPPTIPVTSLPSAHGDGRIHPIRPCHPVGRRLHSDALNEASADEIRIPCRMAGMRMQSSGLVVNLVVNLVVSQVARPRTGGHTK